MRKTLILIVVVVILVVVAICVARRRPKSCCVQSSSQAFKGVKRDDSDKPVAKVNMILNAESKLLSYAIVLKGLKDEVDSVFFVVDGKEIFQASGPRNPQEEGGEIVVHGLWREKSKVPITSAHIEDLSRGKMVARVNFKDQNLAPFSVSLLPK
jgi:hypothetical protein